MKIQLLVFTVFLTATMLAFTVGAQDEKKPELPKKPVRDYPKSVKEISYLSAADETEQPALFWKPKQRKEDERYPLLVALHTWSNDYQQKGGEVLYAEWCQAMNWVFIHPNFRGQNWNPDAMGSDLAVGDIISAVNYAKANAKIDPNRIYCIGVSGGGHASLLMAGRAPEIWAGVSAWCGIADIEAWHRQCEDTKFSRYSGHIEKALGGNPQTDPELQKQAMYRSPLKWLANAKGVNLDIYHGITDGRSGSVPFTHSLHAWNQLVEDKHQVRATTIDQYYRDAENVEQLWPSSRPSGDFKLYGKKIPLYQKTSERTRLTLFNGGHEILHDVALNWLAAQRKDQAPKWKTPVVYKIPQSVKASESGK